MSLTYALFYDSILVIQLYTKAFFTKLWEDLLLENNANIVKWSFFSGIKKMIFSIIYKENFYSNYNLLILLKNCIWFSHCHTWAINETHCPFIKTYLFNHTIIHHEEFDLTFVSMPCSRSNLHKTLFSKKRKNKRKNTKTKLNYKIRNIENKNQETL